MERRRPTSIAWQAVEHNHYKEKTADWFWGLGIVTIGIAVLSIYFGNILFAVIIALFAIVSSMLVAQRPKLMDFELSRKGIKAGPIMFPYSNLESFWVDDGEFDDKIIFRSKKSMSPLVIIPFDSTNTDPESIRDFLLDYLDEEELEEPFYHVLLEVLGF